MGGAGRAAGAKWAAVGSGVSAAAAAAVLAFLRTFAGTWVVDRSLPMPPPPTPSPTSAVVGAAGVGALLAEVGARAGPSGPRCRLFLGISRLTFRSGKVEGLTPNADADAQFDRQLFVRCRTISENRDGSDVSMVRTSAGGNLARMQLAEDPCFTICNLYGYCHIKITSGPQREE